MSQTGVMREGSHFQQGECVRPLRCSFNRYKGRKNSLYLQTRIKVGPEPRRTELLDVGLNEKMSGRDD